MDLVTVFFWGEIGTLPGFLMLPQGLVTWTRAVHGAELGAELPRHEHPTPRVQNDELPGAEQFAELLRQFTFDKVLEDVKKLEASCLNCISHQVFLCSCS